MGSNFLSALSIIGIVAVAGSLLIALIQVFASLIRDTVRTRHQELSRREIAAYIAEGAMTPDEGERLMNAGGSPRKSRNG